MLLPRHVLDGIAAGELTLAFRRFRRPTVRAGGTLRTRIGVLAIEAVELVAEDEITDDDAVRAGFRDREALLRRLPREGPVHRVTLRLAGPDPRVELRERATLAASEREAIGARLARLDRASRSGPWTRAVLELIEARPAVLAAELAADLGREKQPFKADVRKLKELGLTESLEVGYRLSPRGRAYLGR